jgi:hypothetical protein
VPSTRSSRKKLPKLVVPKEAIKQWKSAGEDEQTIKCYSVETFAYATSPGELKDFEEVKQFVYQICKGDIWQKKYRNKQLTLIYGLRKGKDIAYGGLQPNGNPLIYLPPSRHGRSIHTILHEMTHAYIGHRSQHSPRFIRLMLRFMKQYEGAFYANRLEQYMYQTGALKRRAA